jgi:PAS domain S-box-containing protein
MVIVDHRGVIRLANAQTEEMFGYGRGELLGRPVEILLSQRFRADHPGHRRAYAASQQVRPMGAGLELSGLRRDGAEFPVEISLSPLQTSEGLLVSAAIRDVSERKAAEQRISELVVIAVSSRDAILTRSGDVGDRIDTLHTQACAIVPTASSLDQAADSILSALLPCSGEPADDVTLLLVRTPGAPRASASTMIHPGPQHLAGGRRFVRDALDAWNQGELAPTPACWSPSC